MKKLIIIFKNEYLNFSRSRLFQTMIVLILLIGLYSIYYGKTEIEHQRKTLSLVKADELKRQADLQKKITSDTLPNVIGNRIYRLVANAPTELSALSIGQRDVLPYYIYLRYNNISRQIFTSEIANPVKLLNGNFDLAFVLIYLFPLLIIALSYNLLSSEKEQGTLSLLLSNSLTIKQLIVSKVVFRYIFSLFLALILLLISVFWIGISLDKNLFIWSLTVALYFIFWFALVYLIVVFQKSSAVNAVSLLGTWVLFVVAIPALINVYQSANYPSSAQFEMSHAMREKMELVWEKYDDPQYRWDMIQRFVKKNPDFKADTNYNWEDKYMFAGYDKYDDEMKPLINAYFENVIKKEKFAQQIGLLSPAIIAQNTFNSLAKTDVSAHLNFIENVKRYHTELKYFFFLKMFNNQPFKQNDFDKIPIYSVDYQ